MLILENNNIEITELDLEKPKVQRNITEIISGNREWIKILNMAYDLEVPLIDLDNMILAIYDAS